jgi:hypothetical protein
MEDNKYVSYHGKILHRQIRGGAVKAPEIKNAPGNNF